MLLPRGGVWCLFSHLGLDCQISAMQCICCIVSPLKRVILVFGVLNKMDNGSTEQGDEVDLHEM